MSREIAAEAAVWVARLHGPHRTARMEQECLRWQSRSAEHRLAFERTTDVWQEVGGITLAAYASAASYASQPCQASLAALALSGSCTSARPVPMIGRRAWAAAAGGLLALIFGALPFTDVERYETGVGERRTVVLRDGSRMSLNTASRARVSLLASRRIVELEEGEALFEVAKDPRRPFVVVSGGVQVRATGTTFAVRSTLLPKTGQSVASAGTLSVTLVEGRVIVGRGAGKDAGADPDVGFGAALSSPIEMEPGERLRIVRPERSKGSGEVPSSEGAHGRMAASGTETAAAFSASEGLASLGATVTRDRPRMDQVMAWQRGEAVFDDSSIVDAVSEMNRYSAIPVVVLDEGQGARLRVSGVFRIGDSAGFARAVGKLHGLRVIEMVDRSTLAPRERSLPLQRAIRGI